MSSVPETIITETDEAGLPTNDSPDVFTETLVPLRAEFKRLRRVYPDKQIMMLLRDGTVYRITDVVSEWGDAVMLRRANHRCRLPDETILVMKHAISHLRAA